MISYHAGNEHSPMDPWGRTVFELDDDGRARLEHHTRAGTREFTARVDPGVVERLRAALATAPPSEPRSLPPDTRLRVLGAGGPTVFLGWDETPGYEEVFAILDSLVRQMGGVEAAPDTLGPAVSELAAAE